MSIEQIDKIIDKYVNKKYRIASFYTVLSLEPIGRHLVRVCEGTACYVRGGPRILDFLERKLDIKSGETTKDNKFTLETVNCLGCCALGPVVEIDKQYFGKLNSSKVEKLLSNYD
jgi:NADH-quinone oxidoreductase subunit E